MNDLRYAARRLRNSPGFTAVAALLLALGIGANCAIFSVIDAILWRELPVRDATRLYRVIQDLPRVGKRSQVPYSVVAALRKATQLEDAFGECQRDVALTEPGPAEQVRAHFVTPNYFSAFEVNAIMGRVLAPDDRQAVVLSYGFWRRRMGGDPGAVGRTIAFHGNRFRIVGVLPEAFNGFSIDTAPDVRLPLDALPLATGDRTDTTEKAWFDLAVRLRPQTAAEQAGAEVRAIWRAVTPSIDPGMAWQIDQAVELDPLAHGESRMRDRFSVGLIFLGAAVALLMVMVCANIAGLFLARSAGRRQEIAVRLALGASRWRLMRETLAEAVLLASVGAICGIAAAFALAPALVRALPPIRDFNSSTLPLAVHIEPDWRVLLISITVAVAAALLFSAAPAIAAFRADLHSPLRSSRATRGWRGSRALVIVEIALCTLQLAAAGLLVRTFAKLRNLDAGFDRDHVVTFTMNPQLNGYTAQQAIVFRRTLLDRVRELPGVRAAGVASIGLMRGTGMKSTVAPAGQRTSTADFMNSSLNAVSPEYFDALGMSIVAGRGFTEDDARGRPSRKPAIVNQVFAERFFPNENPVGRSFGIGTNTTVKDDFEIIGVVSDAKYRSLREPVPPTAYHPFVTDQRIAPSPFVLHVRTATRPEAMIAPVREIIRAIDPMLPIVETHTLAEEVDATLWNERLVASLASIFAIMAAILAAVGLYGLLARAVTQRTREIGIRMALGAGVPRIFSLIGAEAAKLVATGVVAGGGGFLLAGPAVRGLLYGIAPNDVATMAAAAVFVALTAAAAIALPLVRAVRVNPSSVLRQE